MWELISEADPRSKRLKVPGGWLVQVDQSQLKFVNDVDHTWVLLFTAPEAPLPAPEAPLPAPEAPLPAPEAPLPAPEAPLPAPEAPLPAIRPGTGLFVSGTKVFDAKGAEFIMRGINTTLAWGWGGTGPNDPTDHNFIAISEIAKTGANTVRCVFSSTIGRISAASREAVVVEAIRNKMVPVIGLWDGTGKTDAASLQKCFDVWLKPDHVAFLKRYERNLVLNPANEWGGFNDEMWVTEYTNGINRLRQAGVHCLIQVDAGGAYGQNPRSIKQAGQRILMADPDKNVMFSLHCYAYHKTAPATGIGSWNDAGTGSPWLTINEVNAIKANGLALVVGEIGWQGSAQVGYKTKQLLLELKNADVGFLAWSWNQNSDSALDFFTNNSEYLYSVANLSLGGQLFVTDSDVGLLATSKLATSF